MGGMVKTLTIKRDKVERLWLVFESSRIAGQRPARVKAAASTSAKGFWSRQRKHYPNPLYFTKASQSHEKLNKVLSCKAKLFKGPQNRRAVNWLNIMTYANKRRDHHFCWLTNFAMYTIHCILKTTDFTKA
jgi:hypothetical protein